MPAVAKKRSVAPLKDLYEIGEIPPLGHVPEKMHAWVIRQERHGPPDKSFQLEVVPTWPIGEDEVLAPRDGGWRQLQRRLGRARPADHAVQRAQAALHIAGSDASGVVWAVGTKVKRWKVGDEVIVHCNQDDGDDEDCNGGDPLLSPSQRIWGYETPDGSFAQFCRVQSRQLMHKPAICPGKNQPAIRSRSRPPIACCSAIRRTRSSPATTCWCGAPPAGSAFSASSWSPPRAPTPSAWSPTNSKAEYVLNLGAKGVINRKEFKCWGQLPPVNSAEYNDWTKEARRFGKAIWDITGKRDVDIVFEHPGEQTFPVSCLVVKRGGMVVFCAGTTGFNLTFDARYVWMRQKRIQGSHFAHLKQASQANRFVLEQRIDPCMSELFGWNKHPARAHEDVEKPASARQHGGDGECAAHRP